MEYQYGLKTHDEHKFQIARRALKRITGGGVGPRQIIDKQSFKCCLHGQEWA